MDEFSIHVYDQLLAIIPCDRRTHSCARWRASDALAVLNMGAAGVACRIFFYFLFLGFLVGIYFELGGSPENFKTYTGLVTTIQRQLPFRNFDFFFSFLVFFR